MIEPYRRYVAGLEQALGVPFTYGNRVVALRNGDEIFPAMLRSIRAAEKNINFLTFVYWTGKIAEEFAHALSERARAGVRVRVLLDSYGTKSMPEQLTKQMKDAGVTLHFFRPLASLRLWRIDKRTHRKILTVDDRLGFTGGVGIAKEWSGNARNPNEWRETHFQIAGPAVRGLIAAFLGNWTEAGGWTFDEPELDREVYECGGDMAVQVIRASSTIGWTDIATVLRATIELSREELLICTPYFAPDPALEQTLTDAAQRGVAVQIIVPGKHTDQKLPQWAGGTSIESLLRAGVSFHVFEPTQIHAKLMVVDRALSVVGSANLNHRSAGKDEECCAAVISHDLATELRAHFLDDLDRSRQLGIEQWSSRSNFIKARGALARLIVEQL